MQTIKSITNKMNTTLSRSNVDENLIQFYRTGTEESWRRKWKVARKWNAIVWKGILPAYHSTMLTACVLVTRDAVRHPRHLVFGKFVCKPNCSWSKAFMNWGLTVYIYMYMHMRGNIPITTSHIFNCYHTYCKNCPLVKTFLYKMHSRTVSR